MSTDMLYARRQETVVEVDQGALVFKPLGGSFGATVEGINLALPATPAQEEELRRALDVYSLLCFPNQKLAAPDELRTLSIFNEISAPGDFSGMSVEGYPQVGILSNVVNPDGTPVGYTNKKGMEWHTDGSGWAQPPVASSLYAIEVPETGGETYFASGYLAFETLPPEERALLDGLTATYSWVTCQRWLAEAAGRTTFLSEEEAAKYPDVDRPFVRVHPTTGRKALWFSIEEIVDIDSMGREASRDLMLGIIDHMVSTPHVVYRHDWQPGDLVIWDNRCLMHSVCDYNYEGQRRIMHQITGLDPNCEL